MVFFKKRVEKGGETSSRAIVTSSRSKKLSGLFFGEQPRTEQRSPLPRRSFPGGAGPFLAHPAPNAFRAGGAAHPGPPRGPSRRSAPVPGRAPGRAPARGALQCPRQPSLPRRAPRALPRYLGGLRVAATAGGGGGGGGRTFKPAPLPAAPAPRVSVSAVTGAGPARPGRPRAGDGEGEHSPQGLGSCSFPRNGESSRD